VVDGANGYVVWDDEQLAQRLGELLADAALRRRMGDEGIRMAQDWGWETVAPRWRARILDVIAGRAIVEDDA